MIASQQKGPTFVLNAELHLVPSEATKCHLDAWRAEEGKVAGDAVVIGHGALLSGFQSARYVTRSLSQGEICY